MQRIWLYCKAYLWRRAFQNDCRIQGQVRCEQAEGPWPWVGAEGHQRNATNTGQDRVSRHFQELKHGRQQLALVEMVLGLLKIQNQNEIVAIAVKQTQPGHQLGLLQRHTLHHSCQETHRAKQADFRARARKQYLRKGDPDPQSSESRPFALQF